MAFDWYRIGFKGVHKTCYRVLKEEGRVPKKISKPTRGIVRGRFKLKFEIGSNTADDFECPFSI